MFTTVAPRPRFNAAPAPQRRVHLDRLLVGGVVLLAVLAVLAVIQKPAPRAHGKIFVLENVDADVSGNGLDTVYGQLVDDGRQLAETGGGSVVFIASSGDTAHVTTTANMAITRDGEAETDQQVIDNTAADRIRSAIDTDVSSPRTGQGRSLLPLFAAASEQAPLHGQPFSIYYVGFGLGTLSPTDARISLAGEPADAVNAIRAQLPRLQDAQIHVVFPAAAGPQESLNNITSAWRTKYWEQLAAAMHAHLASVNTSGAPAASRPDSPPAPVIHNIPDPTPVPRCHTHCGPVKPNPVPVVLGGGNFIPDSDQFADPAAARAALAPLAAAWTQHPGGYTRAACQGRTAAFGPAASARELSQLRAAQAAAQLKSLGIGTVTAAGLGFDDPLKGYATTDPQQRSVICQLVPKH